MGCHIGVRQKWDKSVTHFKWAAILANLLPGSGNLASFESVWLQIFWFGEFWRLCSLTYSCVGLLFSACWWLKIGDIKWKCDSFESRSMVLNTPCKNDCKILKLIIYKCLENVDTVYAFWKNTRRKIKELWTTDFQRKKIIYWWSCNHFRRFGCFFAEFGYFFKCVWLRELEMCMFFFHR